MFKCFSKIQCSNDYIVYYQSAPNRLIETELSAYFKLKDRHLDYCDIIYVLLNPLERFCGKNKISIDHYLYLINEYIEADENNKAIPINKQDILEHSIDYFSPDEMKNEEIYFKNNRIILNSGYSHNINRIKKITKK